MNFTWSRRAVTVLLAAVVLYIFLPDIGRVAGQNEGPDKKERKKKKGTELELPPKLPDGKDIHTVTSDEFLKAPATIDKDVVIAKTAPTIDFMYYPCQTYRARIWSNWGDGLAVNGKYYSSLGDHDAPKGNAFVYEYDPVKKALRLLTDVASVIGEILKYLPARSTAGSTWARTASSTSRLIAAPPT